jgi:maltose alpha-D-glucosyltransferase/alpha-amylase
MMRSFSYASSFALNRFMDGAGGGAAQEGYDALRDWIQRWDKKAGGLFLHAYRSTIAANREIMPAQEPAQILLDAYLLEKALYELVYELNNRPAWVSIPISGILSL